MLSYISYLMLGFALIANIKSSEVHFIRYLDEVMNHITRDELLYIKF